jgi:acyl-CoA thioesterase FadM
MFLLDHAPGFLERVGREFTMVTKSVHCEYDQELRAFDRIVIRMRLDDRGENTLRMLFDYFRVDEGGQEQRIARGAQEIACLDARGEGPKPFPPELVEALERYAI